MLGFKTRAAIMQGSDTMKSWRLALLGLVPLLIAGCRSDPAIALLERDNYRKDQEIRHLKWQIDDMQGGCYAGQGMIGEGAREEREPEPKSNRSRRSSNGDVAPPEIDLGRPTNKVPDALKPGGSLPSDIPPVPPEIQGPSGGSSRYEGPSFGGDPDQASLQLPRVTLASSQSAVPFRPKSDSRSVASIAIDPAVSGGIGSGDASGDRGLLGAVQPLDARGRLVDAPAEVHVTAFDQSQRGEAARIGRWDFSAAETASLFCRSANGAAIHLAMGWPEQTPKHKNLLVFVRYVTADGRKLEAKQSVEIALAGERTARWTPAEQPRPAERTVRPEPPLARDPPVSSWRRDEPPTEERPESVPYIASRTRDTGPERPVWSPERR